MVKKLREKDEIATREAKKYENPIASREYILDLLELKGKPASYKKLILELELTTSEDKEALRRRLKAMVRDGQLLLNRRGAFCLIDSLGLLKGYVVGHKDGFGFLVPEDGSKDLFLNARQVRSVFPGDEVLVNVSGIDSRGRREASIVEVVNHNTKSLVGRYIEEAGAAFIEPSNKKITQTILIPLDMNKKALSGQMVVIEIIEQPTKHKPALARVTEILGDHMAPGMEIDVAIRNHDIPVEWPKSALKEANKFSSDVSEASFKNRLDLREKQFITIDGPDAKDFDDAVFCEPRKAGGWTLFVAIADVGHYVKSGSSLDEEALNRGNSVYFPERVIPMLPEVLSNGLCSLKPKVNRLTLVCEMSISKTGKITKFNFSEAVIKSHARLTYDEVFAMINNKDEKLQTKHKALMPHIKELYSVYELLHSSRKKRGAIDFDLPETRIIFGENRKIEKIVPVVRNDAHKLIEECMLCANICAARYLIKAEANALYRVHEGPSVEKLVDLKKFLGELGLKLPGKQIPISKDYAKLLSGIKDRQDAHLIQIVLLRSLSQAIYHPENKGHFGLAFDAYTHFTSPIRRYPDLIVHRAIRSVIQGKNVLSELESRFQFYGEHCSKSERRADEATRETIDWLKCEYMMDKVGEEFDGIISSVTNFGMFIMLSENYVEGLVHISMLKNDYYKYDPIKHALLGERAGKRFRLGDHVRIKVAKVNLDQKQIDFILADDVDKPVPVKKKKKKKVKKL
ncbi:ribonuclease R [Gammaproteobacteria bacterium]|nr:ribonuclease R [Gammaproteobacteria bacterium]